MYHRYTHQKLLGCYQSNKEITRCFRLQPKPVYLTGHKEMSEKGINLELVTSNYPG